MTADFLEARWFRESRDAVMLLIALALGIEVPLRLAFVFEWERAHLTWEIAATLLLTGDLLLNFFTPYREHHHTVRDRARIARRYLRGWFPLDLIAALPLAFLGETLGAGSGLAAMLGINRLARVTRIVPMSRAWHARHLPTVHPSLFRLVLFVFLVSLFAHWTACGWLWLGGGA